MKWLNFSVIVSGLLFLLNENKFYLGMQGKLKYILA